MVYEQEAYEGDQIQTTFKWCSWIDLICWHTHLWSLKLLRSICVIILNDRQDSGIRFLISHDRIALYDSFYCPLCNAMHCTPTLQQLMESGVPGPVGRRVGDLVDLHSRRETDIAAIPLPVLGVGLVAVLVTWQKSARLKDVQVGYPHHFANHIWVTCCVLFAHIRCGGRWVVHLGFMVWLQSQLRLWCSVQVSFFEVVGTAIT